jgi:predicted ATP-binding protein involved in virulence
MIQYLEYIGSIKTIIKYASYFIEIHSSLFDVEHPHFFTVKIKDESETPLTFLGSIVRFVVFLCVAEGAQRINFTN